MTLGIQHQNLSLVPQPASHPSGHHYSLQLIVAAYSYRQRDSCKNDAVNVDNKQQR